MMTSASTLRGSWKHVVLTASEHAGANHKGRARESRIVDGAHEMEAEATTATTEHTSCTSKQH